MLGWSISARACRSASNRATTWRVSMPALMILRATLRLHGLSLLGHPDLAHAPLADPFQQLVGADEGAGALGRAHKLLPVSVLGLRQLIDDPGGRGNEPGAGPRPAGAARHRPHRPDRGRLAIARASGPRSHSGRSPWSRGMSTLMVASLRSGSKELCEIQGPRNPKKIRDHASGGQCPFTEAEH